MRQFEEVAGCAEPLGWLKHADEVEMSDDDAEYSGEGVVNPGLRRLARTGQRCSTDCGMWMSKI